MDEWHVGDPADWGDSVGVPDIPYMGYLNGDDEDEPPRRPKKRTRRSHAESLGLEAWKLYMDYRDTEALNVINRALSYDQAHSKNWNRKAIILESLGRYSESRHCYDKSLRLRRSNVVADNKARMLKDWAWKLYDEDKELEFALSLVDEAIGEISRIQSEEDVLQYEALKRKISSRIEILKGYDDQQETLERIGRENLITIAGTYYYGSPAFSEGMRLKLLRELDNEHDPDAIAVYRDDEKVGYVSNSYRTCCGMTSRAGELEGLPDISQVEYLMNYRGSFHIARLCR